MPITDRLALFGYSASETEKSVDKIKAEFEHKKSDLEKDIEELEKQIEEIRAQIEIENNNKASDDKIPYLQEGDSESKEQKMIMEALYEAHINSTEKIMNIQKNISVTLENKKALILIRERKANEMKEDLQNLIDYIDSIAKNY
jgi:TolA-binding protein